MPDFFLNKAAFHPLSGKSIPYYIHDKDDANDTKYYGFVDLRGTWVIMKESTAAGTFRYATGKSLYSSNWTVRASLSYGYYNEIT